MTTTALSIITAAMQKLGILTKTQKPSADEANDALAALNAMLSSWSNDSMLCYARTWETFPLQGGKAEYLIGPGASDFDTARPISIVAGYTRLNGFSDQPIQVVNDEIYTTQIGVKSAPGFPDWLSYDNGYPVAKIRLWPVPAAAYDLFILSEKQLGQFTLHQPVDLPPGWERALVFNLPAELSGDYDQPVPDAVARIAMDSKNLIQKAVRKNRSLDATPQQGTPNNIYTGWNR